jgi:hypothetical protein
VLQFKETDAQPEVAPPTNVAETSAAKKVATAAAKGFAASEAAYRAQTTTFETLCIWSERWVEAELEAATTPAQKRAALEANLKRFQKLHEEVAKLAAVGAQGGEATHVATTEFYLARAERRLAAFDRANPGAERRFSDGPTVESSGTLSLTLDVPATNLLYEGKDFGYWRNALRNELSVERRTEALRALAAFAAHGYGPAAMQATIDAMSDTSIWAPGRQENTFSQVALEMIKHVSPPSALPIVTKALKTGHANQRLFAAAILPQAALRSEDVVPLLVEATRDQDRQVRTMALFSLATDARQGPETIAALRAALESQDVEGVINATRIVGGQSPTRSSPIVLMMRARSKQKPITELAPDVVALLGSASQQVHDVASATLRSFDSKTLEPLLNQQPASEDPAVRNVLEEILKEVRAAEAKRPAR